jgi:hypothetical protein
MMRLGPVILIVEDEFLLRLDSAETIESAGFGSGSVAIAASMACCMITMVSGGKLALEKSFIGSVLTCVNST